MRDTVPDDGGKNEDDVPMTILAVNGGYWLYEGEDLLNDLLFGRGAYPFSVRCVQFRDAIELRQFFGEAFSVSSLWRINPDVINRLRREGLLLEIAATDPD
jgi:hypothetical protein